MITLGLSSDGGTREAAAALWTVLAISSAWCAPSLTDLKPALSAEDVEHSVCQRGEPSAPSRRVALNARRPDSDLGNPRIPPGTATFPAVVLAHGCNGIGTLEFGRAWVLREWGYATFVLDSFRGRGLLEVCTNAQTLIGTQRIPDAYGALRILVTHPRIDARRWL